MLDEHDPHFALGIEHARHGWMPYEWTDPEHQRRYDLGYRRVQGERVETEWQRFANQDAAVYRQLQRLQGYGNRQKP